MKVQLLVLVVLVISGTCFAEFGVNVVCIDKDLKKLKCKWYNSNIEQVWMN